MDVRSPFQAGKVSRVPLNREDVDCFVFWSKDPMPMLGKLELLDGYNYYFQFTITPYDRDVETNLRSKSDIVNTFKTLSERIGKERVILRYDPILLTDKYTVNYHKKSFEWLMGCLEGYTEKVVIGFMDQYVKTHKSMQNIKFEEITWEDRIDISSFFSKSAAMHGITVESCAEATELWYLGIKRGSCIDRKLVEKIINNHAGGLSYRLKNPGKDDNREYCGCVKSIDIGQYDTCIHGCLYCYVNAAKELAMKNYHRHNSKSAILSGSIEERHIALRKDTGALREETLENAFQNCMDLE